MYWIKLNCLEFVSYFFVQLSPSLLLFFACIGECLLVAWAAFPTQPSTYLFVQICVYSYVMKAFPGYCYLAVYIKSCVYERAIRHMFHCYDCVCRIRWWWVFLWHITNDNIHLKYPKEMSFFHVFFFLMFSLTSHPAVFHWCLRVQTEAAT